MLLDLAKNNLRQINKSRFFVEIFAFGIYLIAKL